MFGCVNSMGGLGGRLELQRWKQPTEEKSLDPGRISLSYTFTTRRLPAFRGRKQMGLPWAGSSSHKERNAERQYGSGKILQATGGGEWNAVFPTAHYAGNAADGTALIQGNIWFLSHIDSLERIVRRAWRQRNKEVRKGKARKLSTSFKILPEALNRW